MSAKKPIPLRNEIEESSLPRAVTLSSLEQLDQDHRYLFRSPLGLGWGAAECRTVDPELFFPIGEGDGRKRAAVSVCSRCDVRAECLELAMDDPSLQGIWGGTDEGERARRRRLVMRSAQGGKWFSRDTHA